MLSTNAGRTCSRQSPPSRIIWAGPTRTKRDKRRDRISRNECEASFWLHCDNIIFVISVFHFNDSLIIVYHQKTMASSVGLRDGNYHQYVHPNLDRKLVYFRQTVETEVSLKNVNKSPQVLVDHNHHGLEGRFTAWNRAVFWYGFGLRRWLLDQTKLTL